MLLHGTITEMACSQSGLPIILNGNINLKGEEQEKQVEWEITQWDKLWKLDLPGKIKIFGWRVLHGMIPCKGVLANKHIGNQGSCPLCPSGCEDIKHMLFTCDRAREVWRCLGVWDRIEEVLNIDRSGSILMEEIIRIGGKIPALNNVGLVELVLTAGWYIWWERRKFVHGESIQTPFISAMSIAALTTNYMMSLRKKHLIYAKDGRNLQKVN